MRRSLRVTTPKNIAKMIPILLHQKPPSSTQPSQGSSRNPSGSAPFYSQYSTLPTQQQHADPSRYPPQQSMNPYPLGAGHSQPGSNFNMNAMAGALPDYSSQSPAHFQSQMQQQGQRRLSGASTSCCCLPASAEFAISTPRRGKLRRPSLRWFRSWPVPRLWPSSRPSGGVLPSVRSWSATNKYCSSAILPVSSSVTAILLFPRQLWGSSTASRPVSNPIGSNADLLHWPSASSDQFRQFGRSAKC